MSNHVLCLITGDQKYQYTYEMIHGVQDGAAMLGATLLTMPLFAEDENAENAGIYYCRAVEAVASLNADVYILPIGNITVTYGNQADYLNYMLNVLKDKKVLILEDHKDGYECLDKDNTVGMQEMMDHLLNIEHYTKIGMIAGPAASFGSRSREKVYLDCMHAKGFETCIGRGSFEGNIDEPVYAFLKEHLDLECVVCANDRLAIEVYRLLVSLGKKPGFDIGVTGFDDMPRAALMDPPLSTVRLDMYEYGKAAAGEAVRMAENKPRKVYVFPSRFILRSSCSIHSDEAKKSRNQLMDELTSQDKIDIEAVTDHILESSPIDAGILYNITKRFTAASAAIVEGKKAEPILPLIHDMQFRLMDKCRYPETLYRSLEVYFQSLIRNHPSAGLSNLFDTIAGTFTRYFYNTRMQNQVHESEVYRAIMRIGTISGMYADEPDQAYRVMLEGMRKAGVSHALLGVKKENNDEMIKGMLDHDEITIFDKNTAPKDVPAFIRENFKGNYYGAVLLNSQQVVGHLMMDAEGTTATARVAISVQTALAIRYLNIFHRERELIYLLNTDNAKLQEEAEKDKLTDLLNRRGFLREVSGVLNQNQGKGAACLYMDLDHLKMINDTYGHESGDFAIHKAAEIIRSALRNTDILARIGGDEYVAFLLNNEDGMEKIRARIAAAFENYNELHEKPFEIDCSVGYASFIIDKTVNIEQMLSLADQSLYQEKRRKHAVRSSMQVQNAS